MKEEEAVYPCPNCEESTDAVIANCSMCHGTEKVTWEQREAFRRAYESIVGFISPAAANWEFERTIQIRIGDEEEVYIIPNDQEEVPGYTHRTESWFGFVGFGNSPREAAEDLEDTVNEFIEKKLKENMQCLQ